jgi:hypothetical protein
MLRKKLIFLTVLASFMVGLCVAPRTLRAAKSCVTECGDQLGACDGKCLSQECFVGCYDQYVSCIARCEEGTLQ